VRAILDSGCPASKIVLGLPAYSRRVNSPGDVKTYSELVAADPSNALRDETAQGGHAYNGVDTVRQKTRWAQEAGLGGVMLWEAGQDTIDAATSLLAAMHAEATTHASSPADSTAAHHPPTKSQSKKKKKRATADEL
jgi:GH18 family chitinase